MIKVKPVERPYIECGSCGSSSLVCWIEIDPGTSSHSIKLCRNCQYELLEKLAGLLRRKIDIYPAYQPGGPMNLNELAEKAFENWLKENFNPPATDRQVETAGQMKECFLVAFHLLSGVVEQQQKALEFYENSKRLMLDVRDLPTEDHFGLPMAYESTSIMDNGDTARTALAATKLAIEEMGGKDE